MEEEFIPQKAINSGQFVPYQVMEYEPKKMQLTMTTNKGKGKITGENSIIIAINLSGSSQTTDIFFIESKTTDQNTQKKKTKGSKASAS